MHENGKNIVEPDISVICDRGKLTDKGCTGAPDWIIDLDAGVREYWIVNSMDQTIFVYHLEKDSFKAKAYTFQDKIKVHIYDDLWIDFQDNSRI